MRSLNLAVSTLALLLPIIGESKQPADARLDQWPLIGGNAFEQHYSPLSQIDEKTVRGLKLAWYADLPTQDGLTGVPLVVGNTVYQSGGLGKAWAHDARTGKQLWEFDAQISFPLGVVPAWGARLSRGLAVWGDTVLKATGDCQLFALDRFTGRVLWKTTTCATKDGRTITGAPRVGDGKVFIGNADADTASGRGHVDAYDVASGRHLWRVYTIPGPRGHRPESKAMAAAANSWAMQGDLRPGGGSPWEGITYDPRTKLVYIGTDGPSPFDPTARGNADGDELYTNALLAVRADTGKYAWHFSTTPHDGWNYSSTMPVVLADIEVNGRVREVILNAPKNGFFYVLDAHTGNLVNEPKPIVEVNWASRIDMTTGRPIQKKDAWYWERPEGAVVTPGPMGARNWMPMSFNPQNSLVYIPVTNYPMLMRTNRDQAIGRVEVEFYWALTHGGPFRGELLAWDPIQQKERWRRVIGFPYQGGTLTTAGNLVFQGTTAGEMAAYQAITGEKIWSFPTVSGVLAAPSTALVDGKQTVFVPVGSGSTSAVSFAPQFSNRADGPARLLAFTLDGNASLPPSIPKSRALERPTVPEPDDALALRGKAVWDSAGCELCHGVEAIGGSGSLPDVRASVAMPLAAFSQIVRGGAFTKQGMPVYADVVSEADLEPLQAYLRQQAWKGFREGIVRDAHVP